MVYRKKEITWNPHFYLFTDLNMICLHAGRKRENILLTAQKCSSYSNKMYNFYDNDLLILYYIRSYSNSSLNELIK